jgi:predicted metal-dependent hydrolase
MEHPVAKKAVRSTLSGKNIAIFLVSLMALAGAVIGLASGVAAWPIALIAGFAGLFLWGASVVGDVFRADNDMVRGDARPGYSERERRQKLKELDTQMEEIVKAAQMRRLKISSDFMQRRTQLRRMVDLERQIATNLSHTEGTISTLPPDIQDEVNQFVERAIDLSFLRAAMLRAFVRTNETVLQEELRNIQGRYERTTGPAKSDIELLLHAKEEQLEAFRRLRNDLVGTEAQLDAIEAFLNTITYGQSLTVGSVRQQMIRLKTKIEARRQSAEEVQKLVNGLER